MSSPTSPDPDPDAPEPDSSRPVPDGGNDGAPEPPEASGFPPPGDDEDDSAAYLGELMAAAAAGEELTAADISGAGFGEGGTAQQLIPGPVLATLVHAATADEKILATLSDDDLAGVIVAVRRIGSFAAWAEMTAIREYAIRPDPRRPAPAPDAAPDAPSGAPSGPSGAPSGGRRGGARGLDSRDPNAAVAGLPGHPKIREFAAEALAPDLHVTWQTAADQITYACTVAARLPVTFAALRAGKIHPVHLRIAEDETAYLDDKYLAEADEKLAAAAQSKTFGQFRSHAHRVVLKLDPESALRRKNEARKDAHVRPFREASGNAGMSARELPPDQVLASWQHIDQRARDLRAAGIPGTLKELRAMAYLDLLQERDIRLTPPSPGHDTAPGDTDGPSGLSDLGETGDLGGTGGPGETDDPGESDDPGDTGNPGDTGGPGESDGPGGPGGPGGNGGSGRGPRNGPGGTGPGAGRPAGNTGPSLAAQVTLTIPWATWQGTSDTPGEAGGFGLLDPETARDLLAAAARHASTRWCYTVLHPDGTAAAHACAPGRHPAGPPDPRTLKFNTVIRGPCNHAQAQGSYRPSRKLRHLITARNATCTAPGCGHAAANCDLDHTTPWHRGGVTCECNLAPLCRHHHRVKQAQGWWLDQSEPGVLRWRTPAGRTHTTTPTIYPM
jgi:hypothetical protein